MIVTCGGRTVYDSEVKSRWTGEIEENRKKFVGLFGKVMTALAPTMYLSARIGTAVLAAQGGDQIRTGFMAVIDVFTAIAEPILWFYALIGCIMMATGKNRDEGWARLKNVGYAYIAIALLPTFFSLMRWIATLVKGSIHIG